MKALTAILGVLCGSVIVVLLLFGGKINTNASRSIGEPSTISHTSSAESNDISPIDLLSINMSKAKVRDQLGFPNEESENQDIYHVDYLGISGHLCIDYRDDLVSGAYWISSNENVPDQKCSDVISFIKNYYNIKIGSCEEMSDESTHGYIWEDTFNNLNYIFYVTNDQYGKTQFKLELFRLPAIDSLSDMSDEEVQAAIEDLNSFINGSSN